MSDMGNDELVKLGREWGASERQFDTADGGKALVIPTGFKVEQLPPLDKPLTRIRQAVTVYDLGSFTDYVERYRSEATRIFALPGYLAQGGKATVRAVLDYHRPGSPDYGVHAVTYSPRYSEAWTRWTSVTPMPQAAFAEFIEENRGDIVDPASSVLLDIVTKFKATKKSDYDSVVYQPNGDVTIAWSEKTENAGKGVAVPQMLQLGVPVYMRGTVYKVGVFLRYRLADGKLTFSCKVDRADLIEQAAFDEVLSAISEKLAIVPYLGSAA